MYVFLVIGYKFSPHQAPILAHATSKKMVSGEIHSMEFKFSDTHTHARFANGFRARISGEV